MPDRICSMGTRGCGYIGGASHECQGAPLPPWHVKQIREVVREELAKAFEDQRREARNAMRRVP